MSYHSTILFGVLALWLVFVNVSALQAHSIGDNPYELSKKRYNETLRYFETEYGADQAAKLQSLKQELITRGHEKAQLYDLLSHARLNHRVVELFEENLLRYADRGEVSYEDFANRIGLGDLKEKSHQFVAEHRNELLVAEQRYGVDYRYIVGIKGIETRYGRDEFTGNFNLLNSLVTQYILSNRQRFSLRELDAVLQLNKKFNAEIHKVEGSYAGAIGVAQWLPTSLLHYSVLEDINGITSTRDMIPSTANYLKENGWDSSLNGNPVEPDSRNWQTIRRYNHSDTYVRIVVEIAEQIER